MKILFISTTNRIERPYLDPSVRYRCYNPAQDMRENDHLADVVSFHKFTLEMIRLYDVFIFHRPPYDGKLEAAIAIIENNNKKYFADYDDLIFAPDYALESSAYLSGRATKDEIFYIFEKNYYAMKLFKNIFVSTDPLQKVIKELHPTANVNIIHNGLSSNWLGLMKNFTRHKKPMIKKITYLSGTTSHEHDFKSITPVLLKFLREHSDIQLVIVGPLILDSELKVLKNVVHKNYVDYNKLPNIIMDSWINLAPLDENIFNQCKSSLKFYESALFGVPSIVSRTPDFERFHDGSIMIADNEDEWLAFLNKMLDEEVYENISKGLKKYSISNCMSSIQSKNLIKIIEGS